MRPAAAQTGEAGAIHRCGGTFLIVDDSRSKKNFFRLCDLPIWTLLQRSEIFVCATYPIEGGGSFHGRVGVSKGVLGGGAEGHNGLSKGVVSVGGEREKEVSCRTLWP